AHLHGPPPVWPALAHRHDLHVPGNREHSADDGSDEAVRRRLAAAARVDRRTVDVRLLCLARWRTAVRPPAARLIAGRCSAQQRAPSCINDAALSDESVTWCSFIAQ